ncbi:19676_t:CDS:2, partial [Gigaspora rosea]
PQTLYEKYCNTFAYYKQVSICNPQPNHQQLMKDSLTTSNSGSSSLPNNTLLICASSQQCKKELEKLPKNAISQRDASKK